MLLYQEVVVSGVLGDGKFQPTAEASQLQRSINLPDGY